MRLTQHIAAALVAAPLALAAAPVAAQTPHGAPAHVLVAPGRTAPASMISYNHRRHPHRPLRHHVRYHKG